MFNILETETGVLFQIKVVPNARTDEIVGLIGDRLKVRVSAPPEDGKANKAVCLLVAQMLGIKNNCVSISSGESSPLKTIAVSGVQKTDFLTLIKNN
ncbi:MAG TPA: DUF167 domain-containing protein [Phycisphaerales bacterium]|nr:DUF167 domain-containing protein [Phycisphaerales bacterium]|tara:strand:+ start:1749 stop:2039 length:291 start_codon:yes stop_codon:yes gene_type:complete